MIVLPQEMIKVLRKQRGLSREDDAEDRQILKMSPEKIIIGCLNYYLGSIAQTERVLKVKRKGVISIFNVRGTTFEGRKEKLLELLGQNNELECPAYLVHEPNNPYDSNAIGVHIVEPDIHIGYVPREICVVLLYGFSKKTFSQYDHKLVIKRDFNYNLIWVEFYLQESSNSRKKLVGDLK